MRNLLVVDDDEVSREVVAVFAATAGYTVTVAASGDAALAALGRKKQSWPDVILADVQMAGTAGETLATCLRTTCGQKPKLIAMSASSASPRGFDSFIQKPFTLEEFQHAVAGSVLKLHQETWPAGNTALLPALDETVYRTLKRSLPDADLAALYALCLDDTLRRIERMRHARRAGLTELYLREAHAIQGSCGFVGAAKLSRLAAKMEQQGLDEIAEYGSGADPLDVLTAERDILQHTVANYRRLATPAEGKQEAQRHGP